MDIPATATTPTATIITTPPGTAGISTGARDIKAIAGDPISVNREAEAVIAKAFKADMGKAGKVGAIKGAAVKAVVLGFVDSFRSFKKGVPTWERLFYCLLPVSWGGCCDVKIIF
jgi:hypothetical protein